MTCSLRDLPPKLIGCFCNPTAPLTRNTMATVSLDNQLFCTPPVASGAPSLLPPLQDAHNPRHGRLGDSLEDAFLISDGESDCDDPNGSTSDSALVALEELPTAGRTRVQSRSVACTGMDTDFPISGAAIRLIRPSRRGCQYYFQCQRQRR